MSTSQKLELLRSVYDAFSRGDIATVLSAFDPEIQWFQAEHNPYQPDHACWIGPEAILSNLFQKMVLEWDAFAIHVSDLWDAGNTLVMEGRYTGTFNQTGERLNAQVCHVWRIRHAKFTRFQQYVDTAQMRRVMAAP
jgi:ketosteroid isomerase-like protein